MGFTPEQIKGRMLLDTYEDKVNKAVLKDAFAATCKKRGTDHLQEQAEEIIKIIEADALSLPIGGIEQLLITQFIIKKGEDYRKISELLHMIAEQH